MPFVAFLTLITPVWIDPLFNDYGPMKDPAPGTKVLDLAGARGGLREPGLRGQQERRHEDGQRLRHRALRHQADRPLGHALRDFDEREVLAVMGHETGPLRARTTSPGRSRCRRWSSSRACSGPTASGRRLVARYQRPVRVRLARRRRRDPAACSSCSASRRPALAPVALAYSRHHEHEADRFALELTHLNRSAALAFADLQRENLGVPRPSLFETLWRSSHPSVAERIEFCNTYRPRSRGTSAQVRGPLIRSPPGAEQRHE